MENHMMGLKLRSKFIVKYENLKYDYLMQNHRHSSYPEKYFEDVAKSFFRLFPIISISQKFFSFFFLTLEKIGIDEKLICYHNISN